MERVRLGVNVDHVATLRQARGTPYPDPVTAASIAELAGADQITIHLREDRRHIQDRDLRLMRQTVQTRLNLEMAAAEEMVAIALEVHPDEVTLVPERREELTTEGGLDVVGHREVVAGATRRLTEAGIAVSLFVDPDPDQVAASRDAGASIVELHTGRWCELPDGAERDRELGRLVEASREAKAAGLMVAAGHGLHYHNVGPVVAIPEIEELNIGHAIVARALFKGFDAAVREMVALMVR
jgi:pyridoxine 5-phosphate synthase